MLNGSRHRALLRGSGNPLPLEGLEGPREGGGSITSRGGPRHPLPPACHPLSTRHRPLYNERIMTVWQSHATLSESRTCPAAVEGAGLTPSIKTRAGDPNWNSTSPFSSTNTILTVQLGLASWPVQLISPTKWLAYIPPTATGHRFVGDQQCRTPEAGFDFPSLYQMAWRGSPR